MFQRAASSDTSGKLFSGKLTSGTGNLKLTKPKQDTPKILLKSASGIPKVLQIRPQQNIQQLPLQQHMQQQHIQQIPQQHVHQLPQQHIHQQHLQQLPSEHLQQQQHFVQQQSVVVQLGSPGSLYGGGSGTPSMYGSTFSTPGQYSVEQTPLSGVQTHYSGAQQSYYSPKPSPGIENRNSVVFNSFQRNR